MEEEELLSLQERDQNDEEDCRITACVIFSTFVAICSSFASGIATGYTSGTEVAIMEELHLSLAQFSAFGSLMTVGAAVGALSSGKLAVLVGRKWTLWISDVLSILGWLSIAFAKDIFWLDFGRISLGMGLGLSSYTVPVYIAEIAPKHFRGTLTSSNIFIQNCGIAVIYFFGNLISWRTLAILGSIPCFVQLIGLFFVPESPRWLAKVGLYKNVDKCLHRLRGRDADISGEASRIHVMTKMVEAESRSNFYDLFQKKYRRTLVVGIGLMLVQQFSGYSGVVYYSNSIFRKSGFSETIGTMVFGIFVIPKSVLSLILVDKWGRRPLLLVSAAGISISCMLIGIAFTFQEMQLLPQVTPTFIFICILVYFGSLALGVGGLPWVIMSEVFPINIKVTGGTVVALVSWCSSGIVSYFFNFFFQWSPQGTFYIFGVIGGASLVFIWWLVPETKGLSLEQIQASLLSRSTSSENS